MNEIKMRIALQLARPWIIDAINAAKKANIDPSPGIAMLATIDDALKVVTLSDAIKSGHADRKHGVSS